MKTPDLAIFCLALLPALSAMADTFQMKDGTQLEGTILSEVADAYIVEVQVSKSIKDERRIAKADVVKLVRVRPDIKAFETISALYPVPDLLTADEYGVRIRTVEKFLKDHLGSLKTPEAKAILAKLKAEANEILAGGIRIDGKIISAADYRRDAYEIDSKVQDAKIRALVKQGSYLPSLRAFSSFSRDFPNTVAHAELLPIITQVIKNYLAEINQQLAGFDARAKQRQLGLERMPAADRRATENAIREETAAVEARFKREKEAKVGWVTTDPYFKPSLDETVTFGKQELTRLAALKSKPAVDGGRAYRDALSLIQARGDKSAITSAISAAKVAQVPQRYIATLEAAAAVR